MSDYTPTTEEVFYTVWMNGVLQERERIIKLLEANHLTAASELIEQDALGENK